MTDIKLIKEGNVDAFEKVFTSYFKTLYNYAFHLVRDNVQAEEMVQQIFYIIWKNRENLEIKSSLKAYLYKAVYNEGLKHIRSNKYRHEHKMHELHSTKVLPCHQEASGQLEYNELTQKYHEALNQLPEQCRTVFHLNRMEGLTYRQIAVELDISIKTVEAHMGKALSRLRVSLADFLSEK